MWITPDRNFWQRASLSISNRALENVDFGCFLTKKSYSRKSGRNTSSIYLRYSLWCWLWRRLILILMKVLMALMTVLNLVWQIGLLIFLLSLVTRKLPPMIAHQKHFIQQFAPKNLSAQHAAIQIANNSQDHAAKENIKEGSCSLTTSMTWSKIHEEDTKHCLCWFIFVILSRK